MRIDSDYSSPSTAVPAITGTAAWPPPIAPSDGSSDGLFDKELDDVADRMAPRQMQRRPPRTWSTDQGPDDRQDAVDEGRDDA